MTNNLPVSDAELDLLAYDIADTIDRGEYRLDVSQGDIRAALPAFIEQLRQNTAACADPGGGADR